jgi:IPT/TIG domain/PASTA domain
MTFRGKTIIVAALVAFAAPTAARAQTTIGQLAPSNPPATCATSFDLAPAGTIYAVPSGGAITSWSTNAAAGGGQSLTFKVYRPVGERRFLVVAHDGPRPLTESTVNTFETNIPVQAGDLIGLTTRSPQGVQIACEFPTGSLGDRVYFNPGDTADGAAFDGQGPELQTRLNLAATFLPAVPVVSAVSPASGPLKGGTEVTITGSNFAEVTGVSFGVFPAMSFRVDTESQITVITPPGEKPASVPIVITTAAGRATAPTMFSYRGCLVPKLRGKTLKAARKLLRKSGCRLGKVTRHYGETAKRSRVVRQLPKPGKVLAAGAKVNLTVVDRPTDV